MNKAQLLQQLAAFPWVGGLNGTARLQEVKEDGTKWYVQNVREVCEDQATFRNVSFYVADEGEETEAAYWKDQVPAATLRVNPTITSEVANDPLDRGYDQMTDEQKLASLNTVNRPRTGSRFVTLRTFMDEFLPADAAAIGLKLQAAAASNDVVKFMFTPLTTYSDGGGLDICSAKTREYVMELASGGVLTSAEAAAINALGLQSRAQELIGRAATAEDI